MIDNEIPAPTPNPMYFILNPFLKIKELSNPAPYPIAPKVNKSSTVLLSFESCCLNASTDNSEFYCISSLTLYQLIKLNSNIKIFVIN